jgi:hypothetical protein
MAGEPQSDQIKKATVNVADADVVTNQDVILLIAADNVNERIVAERVTVSFAVLPTAALVDIIFRDDSANAETTLADDKDVVTSQTAAEGTEVWAGKQTLDPGDTLRALLTGVTAGSVEGCQFDVEYTVEKHS